MKILTFTWFASVIFAFAYFYDYGRQEGSFQEKGNYLEANNWLAQKAGSKNSLVIFLHPKCPCSRASVEEYSNIILENKEYNPIVIFSIAEGLKDYHDDIIELKEILERSDKNSYNYIEDIDLEIAKKFGALTSGYTLLFEDSELKFRGGLTPTRAHIGKTKAHDFIKNQKQNFLETPVYGCEIANKECIEIKGKENVERTDP